MIAAGNLGGPGHAPTPPTGTRLLASLDVEWTKNYRIKNGNVPFCYSIVYLAVPDGTGPTDLAAAPFWWTSGYVEESTETGDLVARVDAELHAALQAGARLTGHQLSSDLAVIGASAGNRATPTVHAVRAAWRARRDHDVPTRPVLDTRYDADHLLEGCTSRRLVDVCTALGLDVTQPELRRTSMTAMHRAWLASGDAELFERIAVLNLRHSLSTSLVAARATGSGDWTGVLNVNQLLHRGLGGQFGWLAAPDFQALL